MLDTTNLTNPANTTNPVIPTCADLAGDEVTDRFDDMINPPGLTNHWATAQVDHDVLALRSVNVPPVSQGDSISGQLYLGGRLARSYGEPVYTRWRPDRVERRTTIDDWRIETVTVCPPGRPGAVVQLTVTNTGADRTLRIGTWLTSTVTRTSEPWRDAEPPQAHNDVHRQGGQVRGSDGTAWSVQELVVPAGAELLDGGARLVEAQVLVGAGESVRFGYVHAIAEREDDAVTAAQEMVAGLDEAAPRSEAVWNASLRALFDPDDAEFSGSLPVLETSNVALRKLYWWGAAGVLWFRRDNPASVLGRTYDTLMPRYWQTTTFIWDYSLSSLVHALLDPAVMRRQIAHWVGLDIEAHFGTEWLTGGPVGYWYSVNHYAMTRLVRDYVAHSGDTELLSEEFTTPDGTTRPLLDHVRGWARAWHRLRSSSGLADYGGTTTCWSASPPTCTRSPA